MTDGEDMFSEAEREKRVGIMKKIVEEQDYDLLARELTITKKIIDKLRAEKYPGIDFKTASLEDISKITGRNFNV